MRVIYIDILITVNIFIDFFLILCTKKSLHINASYFRMTLGSVLGGILSLVALAPKLMFAVNLLVDILGAAAIVFAVFGKCSIKTYLQRVLIFFSYSFSFSGIMLLFCSYFKPSGMAVYNDIIYFNISPVLLIILTLLCYYIMKIIKRMTKGTSGGGVCNVEIDVKNKKISFCAKIDSGCNLKEPFSGDYVIVVEKEAIENYVPEDKSTRVIPFGSLGGTGIIKGFKPEKIKINGIMSDNNVYIGICENIIKGDVKALIPGELVLN